MLPETWNGTWSGEVKVIADGETRHRVNMELQVTSIAGRPAKTWMIHYSGQPPRNYEIIAADHGKDRFVIDEKNGSLLDQQLIGDTLHSVISVGTVLLTSRFQRVGEKIHVEITTYDLPSGNPAGGAENPVVSYPFRSIQVGVLSRQKKIDGRKPSKNGRGGEI